MSIFTSSTAGIPHAEALPRHVAIIMDGNGRWAKKRLLPRFAGHKRGLDTVREVVRYCIDEGIEYLTLFAFSSENWRRPQEEVSLLMQLFASALRSEIAKLEKNQVRLRVVGDLAPFGGVIQKLVLDAEQRTEHCRLLNLTIAANYGGRWDITQSVNQLLSRGLPEARQISEQDITDHLCMAFAPEPDLFIRTGGEQRISNFLVWQLAYSELYFTDCLWPDFDRNHFSSALASYARRERRFGRTSDQVKVSQLTGE